MPSVGYYNQSAPFWDFVASMENQANAASASAARADASSHDNEQSSGWEGAFPPWFFPPRGGRHGHRGPPHNGPPHHAPPHHAPTHHGPPHHGPPPPPNDAPMPPPPHGGPPHHGPPHHGPPDHGPPHGSPSPPPPPPPPNDAPMPPPPHSGPPHGPESGPSHPHDGDNEGRHGPGGPRGRCGGRGGWGSKGRGFPFAHYGGGFGGPFGNNLNDLAQAFHEQFFGGNTGATDGDHSQDFKPSADVFDTPEHYTVHLSLPGAKKEDVAVSWDAEKSELTVSGVIFRPGTEELLKALALDERKEVGAFEKKVRLGSRANPAAVDVEGISAKLEDGVLRVEVPKLGDEGFVEVKKVEVE